MATVRRVADTALIALFAGALVLVLVATVVVPRQTVDSDEKRKLATMPEPLPLDRFSTDFDRFFGDHFGLRDSLIRWHHLAKVRWLDVSPSPRVLLGKDGWLFYAADGSIDSYRRAAPMDPVVTRDWSTGIEAKRSWLADRGIPYLFVVAPSKHTVYPEFMPDEIRPGGGPTRLDQLLTELQADGPTPHVLDLRAPLIEAKQIDRLYHRTDTHWNSAGAAVAYNEILKSLSSLRGLPANALPVDLSARPVVDRGGDLAIMLRLRDRFVEELPAVTVAGGGRAQLARRLPDEWSRYEIRDAALPTALVFHDSFGNALVPYLAEHFSRVVFVAGPFDSERVRQERPEVVIEEMCERFLMKPPPELPQGLGPESRLARGG